MTENVDRGWSFDEAFERTSDPRLWDRYQAEKRQRVATLADLRHSVVAELLAKIGTRLFAAVSKTADGGERWITLDRAALEERIAGEGIEEVRLFAPLKGPNAVERVRDHGLADAFQQFVLDDPEIAALLKRNNTPDLFNGGRAPGPFINYYWPVEATADQFARSLTRTGMISLGAPPPTPAREVVALSEALADRIGALRALFVSGKLQAYGLTASFTESLVPARLWTRKNLSIDVGNGDLCEENDRGGFSTLWTSVELRSAASEAPREERSLKATAPAVKRSRKGREVERIIRERGIDVEALGRKAAAVEVAHHMSSPPRSANATKALEAQVARIWRVIKETP